MWPGWLPHPFGPESAPVKPFGTSSWQSYALFRAGAHADERGRFASAGRLYHAALDTDPMNRGARLNLARLEARFGRFAVALDQCQRIREESEATWSPDQEDEWQHHYRQWSYRAGWHVVTWLKGLPVRLGYGQPPTRRVNHARLDNVWYQVLYQLAVLSYYRATEIQVKRDEFQPLGSGSASDRKIAAELHRLVEGLDPAVPEAGLMPSDVVLVSAADRARQNLLKKAIEYGKELIETIESTQEKLRPQAERRAWDTHPSLREQDSMIEQDRQLWRYLGPFAPSARAMYAGCLVTIGKDAAAGQQVEKITFHDRSHHRVQYNLACYHSLRGLRTAAGSDDQRKANNNALRLLEQSFAVAPVILVEWAMGDLSLRGVRENVDTRSRFEKLFTRRLGRVPTPPASRLADLAGVGEAVAQQLQDRGIHTLADFCELAQSADERKALATSLDVSPRHVLRWALLADLTRVPGIDAHAANLLGAAGVPSILELKRQDPDRLKTLLKRVNANHSYLDESPDEQTVKAWVMQAIATTPMVSER